MFGKLIDNRSVFRAVHDEDIVLQPVLSLMRNTQLNSHRSGFELGQMNAWSWKLCRAGFLETLSQILYDSIFCCVYLGILKLCRILPNGTYRNHIIVWF